MYQLERCNESEPAKTERFISGRHGDVLPGASISSRCRLTLWRIRLPQPMRRRPHSASDGNRSSTGRHFGRRAWHPAAGGPTETPAAEVSRVMTQSCRLPGSIVANALFIVHRWLCSPKDGGRVPPHAPGKNPGGRFCQRTHVVNAANGEHRGSQQSDYLPAPSNNYSTRTHLSRFYPHLAHLGHVIGVNFVQRSRPFDNCIQVSDKRSG